jgi:hypothetical protein
MAFASSARTGCRARGGNRDHQKGKPWLRALAAEGPETEQEARTRGAEAQVVADDDG